MGKKVLISLICLFSVGFIIMTDPFRMIHRLGRDIAANPSRYGREYTQESTSTIGLVNENPKTLVDNMETGGYVFSTDELEWTLGGINASTGLTQEADNRIQSTLFFPVNSEAYLEIGSRAKVGLRFYSDNTKESFVGISEPTWLTKNCKIMDIVLDSGFQNVCYYRLVVGEIDDSPISDVSNLSSQVRLYPGLQRLENLSWEMGNYNASKGHEADYKESDTRVRIDMPISTGKMLKVISTNKEVVFSVKEMTSNIEYRGGTGWVDSYISQKKDEYILISAKFVDDRVISNDQIDVISNAIQTLRWGEEESSNYDFQISTVDVDDLGSLTMATVKYQYQEGAIPETTNWIYRTNKEPFRFYKADATIDNFSYLFTWDPSVTDDGKRQPVDYSVMVTDENDFVFVWRGEKAQYDGIQDRRGLRQNPIIYSHEDYSKPIVVDFENSDDAPTSWLQNDGVFAEKSRFYICEYTRNEFDSCYVWRVSYPYTSKENWEKILSFSVGYPIGEDGNSDLNGTWDGEQGFKHCHNIDRDPFSGILYLSTGDHNNAASIYYSVNNGNEWIPLILNSEKLSRQLNFIWLPDGIYWATDSSNTDFHRLFRARRLENGLMDTRDESVEELFSFYVQAASYHCCYIKNPRGLLILDRYDYIQSQPLNIWFYDLELEQMNIIGKIDPVMPSMFGFRCEAVNKYQSNSDDRIVCGFSYFPNQMELLGNKGNQYVNSINGALTIEGGDESNVGCINNVVLSISRNRESIIGYEE